MVILAYKNFGKGVCHVGLGISADTTAHALGAVGIQAEVLPVVDGYDLEMQLKTRHSITNVILYAPWADIPFLAGLADRMPHIRFTVTCHSNVGFLQSDVFAMKCMRRGAFAQQSRHNLTISGNCITFCRWASSVWDVDCAYLPNLYPVERFKHPRLYCVGTLRIGMFGATRQLKNLVSGAAAALLVSKQMPVDLHMSTGRNEGGHGVFNAIEEMLVNQSRLTLVKDDWRDWHSHRDNIEAMHVLLQPSYTESFNMVTADGIAMGVPSIVSPAINWVPHYWQANPDDPTEIATKLRNIVRNPHAAADGHKALAKHNAHGVRAWQDYLGL